MNKNKQTFSRFYCDNKSRSCVINLKKFVSCIFRCKWKIFAFCVSTNVSELGKTNLNIDELEQISFKIKLSFYQQLLVDLAYLGINTSSTVLLAITYL